MQHTLITLPSPSAHWTHGYGNGAEAVRGVAKEVQKQLTGTAKGWLYTLNIQLITDLLYSLCQAVHLIAHI